MTRIALGIEYCGSAYSGWQRQRHVSSVQQTLELVLSKIADEAIETQCAGRTDAGVHASGQVVHFDVQQQRPLKAWTMGVNSQLPDDIAVRWAQVVPDNFHARFSATARRYRYIIDNKPCRPGIFNQGFTHVFVPLDASLMHQAAQALVGEHDFSAFRAVHCQSHTPFRCVEAVSVVRHGDYVVVDITANAFLHHMVRNIVGSLLEVGKGQASVTWLGELLAGRDRTQAAATAKAHGLYLVDVRYPAEFALPSPLIGPMFAGQWMQA